MPQKAHLNGSKGDPPKMHFLALHFPDFPILTSVGGPCDRNLREVSGPPLLAPGRRIRWCLLELRTPIARPVLDQAQ